MTQITLDEMEDPNRRYTMARLTVVRERLARFCFSLQDRTNDDDSVEKIAALENEAGSILSEAESQPALDQLCEGLRLSNFERDLLLLCLGIELDPQLGQMCGATHSNAQMAWPTFRLGLTLLADPHWSAITPDGPLRRWRLIEVERGESLMTSPLRIDERVMHFLVGTPYLDERLAHFLEPVQRATALPASYGPHIERIANLWAGNDRRWPIIHLTGESRGTRRSLAATSCAALDLRLYALRVSEIPTGSLERETLLRLWKREALLLRSALLLESEDGDDAIALRNGRSFARRISSPVFTSGPLLVDASLEAELKIEINRPTADEQRALWERALGTTVGQLNGQLDQIVSQFQFDADSIQSVGRTVTHLSTIGQSEDAGEMLWQICRNQARASLGGLAEPIKTRACWEDLVLPDEQYQTLGEIAAQVRQRLKVYESWGFAGRSARGLGISALFAGPSGTGKTLAAEVLANDLNLDLYRIDLSQVVSKYIGETEKNLRAVFDAAEQSGAVLLFDEADALFGKRSEVRDSHDRYANIEVSYLLQRMESYGGLAILTTNRRNALDDAFLRRIRFIVAFPFPDAALRTRIWSHIFPPETPTQDLDFNKLARLNVTGGNIRNIALNAAFLAADMGQPVAMSHLLRTARSECLKMERQTTAAEVGGWV